MSNVKIRHAEETRERLRSAALALFARKGYDATSTREIAAAAECNIAMISHYYSSKEGLLLAVIGGFLAAEGEELRRLALSGLTPEQQFTGFIDFLIDDFVARPRAMLVIHRELPEGGTHAAAALRQQMARNLDLIAELVAATGTCAHSAPRRLAHALIGLLVFYFDPDRVDTDPPTDAEVAALKQFVRTSFLGSAATP